MARTCRMSRMTRDAWAPKSKTCIKAFIEGPSKVLREPQLFAPIDHISLNVQATESHKSAAFIMAACPVKRRNLEYTEIYQRSLATDDLALDASQQDLLRAAARKWASKNKWELGSFSLVTFTPTDEWLCSALCYMHVECHSRSGSSFRFTGRLNDGVYRLRVEQAGKCGPTQHKARAAKRFSADVITVEDRRAVVDCAEQLMASSRKATTAAVVKRLAADGRSLPTALVRAILRWMRKQGAATKQFRESQLTFALSLQLTRLT